MNGMAFVFDSVPQVGFFTSTPNAEWSDWKWQMRNSVHSLERLQNFVEVYPSESKALANSGGLFRFAMTPYALGLLQPSLGEMDPMRRIMIPRQEELAVLPDQQQLYDPLNERSPQNRKASRIVHRYPDRCLFLVTDFCSVYCRYCTRKNFTATDSFFPSAQEYNEAIEYIKKTKGIKEVILSGGDPLTLSTEKLSRICSDLRAIDHVEIIRIGTRMPVVNPFRVDEELVQSLKRFHPVYVMVHFNHPRELTAESARALTYFADNGFPIMNQLVLLNGVNNDPAIISALHRRLLYLRVKPYYMFQCDPVVGSEHLRVSVAESKHIQRQLWGNLSGLASASLIVDLPGGGGKVGVVPDFELKDSDLVDGPEYVGFDGMRAQYKNPENQALVPLDAADYKSEWQEILDSKTVRGVELNG